MKTAFMRLARILTPMIVAKWRARQANKRRPR